MICGWCNRETTPGRCSSCGRDPALPWIQRGEEPPDPKAWQLAAARRALGPRASVEAIAEHLQVSARTVRRWQAGGLAVSHPND